MERGEALSAPLALPTEKIAHLDAAGDCRTAGFQLAHVRFESGADARIHLPMSALPPKADMVSLPREPGGGSHCGKNRTLRDSISLPQLVFLPRAEIAGNAAIFSPRWTMNAS